ncbi:MFS transporter [Cellulomonas sp. C5510]|uniref:MFS transporter n=1 Tax=Cellulomonas sp. C5510 TaxID=2871170 RepID=UPI001C94B1BF|nr:MFS transporter [Cellulomonas sp. C5510]QZN84760.1 MFS transporter [Cellulomonas sp. C5510]
MPTTLPAADAAAPTDEQQTRVPVRLGIALALGCFLWLGPYLGVNAVLLPARIAEIAPDDKTSVVALLATVAMIVATLANIVIGAFSDLTRSRWGRRTPWLLAGSVGSAALLLVVGRASSVGSLLVAWAVYQVFLNAIVAPLIAVISDRIAPRHRGTISSVYAFGYSAGLYGGQIIGAQFLGGIGAGFAVLAGLTLLSGPVAALIMREPSSRDLPRRRVSRDMLLDSFSLPRRDCRDYYLALFGKFAIISATFAVSGYQLYILTDYMALGEGTTAGYISSIATILMVTALVMSAVSGPVSDRLGRRKLPVVVAGVLVAIGVLVPAVSPSPWTMLVYAVVAGVGMGAFNAVDQALNVEVLPDQETAAKDLGVLNLANTGGQIVGPIVAAAAISAVGYQAMFPAAAVLALVGAGLILAIRRVR